MRRRLSLPGLGMLARSLAAALMAMALAGCGSGPASTVVDMQFTANAELNPDVTDRPSPVIVKVYALAAEGQFRSADFFPLFNEPEATLGADLLELREIAVRPDGGASLTLESGGTAAFVGVVAAFQDIDNARWRDIVPVESGEENSLTVSLTGVTVEVANE